MTDQSTTIAMTMNDVDFDSQFWLDVNDRRNVWHFYYFVAKNIMGHLQSFTWVANIPKRVKLNPLKNHTPAECFSLDCVCDVNLSLRKLIEYFEEEDYMSTEDVDMLKSSLHALMNVVPYLNDRHFNLSRYEYENYPAEMWCSFDDIRNLDRSLAKRIAPVMRRFAQCSRFPPPYFSNMFSSPTANPCAEWRKALGIMADAWDWLAKRDCGFETCRWEPVPDEVYYGLHLFAEYLPEMQNN